MKNNILSTILFITLAISAGRAQEQIVVDLRVSPPFDLGLDGLTNQLLATVSNTNFEAELTDVNFRLEMYGPKGLRIYSSRVFNDDLDLEPGEIRSFVGNDWEELYGSTDLTIEPIEEKERLLDTQSFRDGSYKICLTAYSTVTGRQLSRGVPSDCDDFTVEVPDPPQIVNPATGFVIPNDAFALQVNWFQGFLKTSPSYTVEIIDASQFSHNMFASAEVFEQAETVFVEEDISSFSYVVEDVDWEEGHEYEIRVSSSLGRNEGNKYDFKLHSRPVRISFKGNAIVADTYVPEPKENIAVPELEEEIGGPEDVAAELTKANATAHFPIGNDTVPFLQFPLVVAFSPKNNTIKRLEFTSNFNNQSKAEDRLTWKRGALAFLKAKIPAANWSQASLIPLADITASDQLKRGQQYNWSADVSLFKKPTGGKASSFAVPQQKFVVGMARPVLKKPSNKDTINGGDIAFEWKTAQKQVGRTLPDFKLMHITKNKSALETVINNVSEHWVLQVFNKEDSYKKEDRVQQYHDKLNINLDEFYDAETRAYDIEKIEEKIYTSLSHSFTITEHGTYWWRISWLRNPEMTDVEIENIEAKDSYHTSELYSFTISANEAIANNTPATDDACTSNCIIAQPSKTGKIALAVGSTTKVGKFNLIVKTITQSVNDTYSGTGLITIPFLNDIQVKVVFKDLKINAENRMYAGDVTAKKDNSFITRDAKVIDGLTTIGMEKSDAEALDNAISDASKTVYEMASGSETTLPLGLDFEIDNHRIRLAIMNIDFKSTTAAMNAMILVDVPIINDDGSKYEETISFGTKDLCFNPGGLGNDIRFYVPEDLELNPADQNVFAVRGHTQVGTEQPRSEKDYTYLVWGCEGFKELNIALQLKFSRETILPEDKNGNPANTGNVIGVTNFNLKREDEKFNFMAEVKFSNSFQLPDENAYGWGFEVDHVWLDLSTVANPPNIKFPDDYEFETTDTRLANTWKGLWIDKVAIKAPHFIESARNEKKKVALEATNFIIDPKLSFSLNVNDLIPLSDRANLNGSHISIDTLFLAMVQNDFKKAGFTGRLALPIAEDKPSQMFKYNVMFDNSKSDNRKSSSFGYVLSAKPAKEAIEIVSKGFMMKGKIAKTSYIEIGYKDAVYSKFKLDGTFGFSTEFDDKKQDRAFTLDMAGVKIEGLEFDSSKEDPFKCDDCLKTSLASPQKTVSGFPLSLKSIDVGSSNGKPVLTIEPQITLMGKDAGFDVSTMIEITANMKKVNGSWNFGIDDARIKKITIEEGTKLGALQVHGDIEFYKDENTKGTRGALTVLLPGDIGGIMSADFGAYKENDATFGDYDTNAKWYSYWYVDGTVLFGTGLPLGAVSLYGMGGGASHHMTQNSLPQGGTLATAVKKQSNSTEKNEVTSSGAKYKPDFDAGLGIKFTSILGSPGGGKVYNFDVTLSGEFSNSGGLRKIELEGNARILPDNDNPFMGEAPMRAYVKFGMENFDDTAKLLLTGNLIVSLDITKGPFSLKGINNNLSNRIPSNYNGPKKNILVEAAFMSNNETDKWYFVMGTPKNRGGVSVGLNLGGTHYDIAQTSGYFLAGNALNELNPAIDLGMPTPTQAFLDIQAQARGVENFRVNNDLKKDNSIGNSVSNAANVKGFQFGLALDINAGAEITPFYFDLNLAIGFDLLLKNVEQCAGSMSTEVYSPPGSNGWYSEGQFYAGIAGEFGLKVDLWFISGKFSILEVAAALMLQGNFPNPEGFRGEGDIGYSILAGLIEGNHHFELTLGEQCSAYQDPSDALNSLNIIQDLKPAKGKETSVFATCAATFGVALNKEFDIPVSKTEIKKVKAYLQEWILEEKGGARVQTQIRMEPNNFAATLQRNNMLNGNKTYKQTIRIVAMEIVNGKEIPIRNKEGTADWYNERIENFTTGDSPDVIIDENVNYTYPLKNQKHFLKEETSANQGYVVLKMAQNQDKKVFDKSTDREFLARFIKIDGNNTHIETPIKLLHNDQTVAFDVSRLENDQVYLVQLLSKKKTPPQNVDFQALGEQIVGMRNKNRGMAELPKDMSLKQTISIRASDMNLLNKASTFSVKERKLPDDLTFDATEKIVYKYYFKTSKYNNFNKKIANVNWNSTNNQSPNRFGKAYTFSSTWDELPENYDKAATSINNLKVQSLIELTVNRDKRPYAYPDNNYMKHVVTPVLGNPLSETIRSLNKYSLPHTIGSNKRLKYSEGVSFSQASLHDTPLTQNETQEAFETQERNMEAINKTLSAAREQFDKARYPNSPTLISADQSGGGATFNIPISGGYQYIRHFIPVEHTPSPQIQIVHHLPPIANKNLMLIKQELKPVYFGQISLWNVSKATTGGNCYYLRTVNSSNHYTSKYKDKYTKKRLYKYIVNKPTGLSFLREFDHTASSRIEKLKATFRSLGYPVKNGQPLRQSFILQYQYPFPSGRTEAVAPMKQGTHVRVTN